MSRHSKRLRGSATASAVVLVVIGLLGTSCARSADVGHAEAVEVLVLDGVDRARADCIVSALDGKLDLAKVTGIDVDLDDGELALLASASSSCTPSVTTGGLVTSPSPFGSPLATEADGFTVDVEAEVQRMVDEGLDPAIADCLVLRVQASAEPADILNDRLRLSEAVVDCRTPAS